MIGDRRWHLAVTWLAVVAYAAVVVGPMLPVGRHTPPATARSMAGKDRSRPFPCMDRPCGCETAEQCFAACCCHSPSERLAWARVHGVEPAVLAALEHLVAVVPSAAGPGCAASDSPPCCSKPSVIDHDAHDVCRDYRFSATAPAVEPSADGAREPVSPRRGLRVVSLRAMLACGGIAVGGGATTVSLPPPPIVVAPSSTEPCDDLTLVDVTTQGVSASLDPPPPRG